MASEIGWELYRTFLGALQAGSLSGAARALDLTQPTVGRHIDALEKALGVTLFTRSQAGLSPTDAAIGLRSYAEAMRSQAEALVRAAESQGAAAKGTVRVTASEVIGVEVLPPILARLRQEHPLLKVELVLANQMQDLLRREADIAVRMTRPTQDVLVARRLGNVELGLFAHRRYLRARGTPASVAELAGHSLIGYDRETPFLRAARKGFPFWHRSAFALRADSDVAQLACIRAGVGIGVCQVKLAMRQPDLVRVLAQEFSMPLDTWVTMHEDLRATRACQVVFDALVSGLGEYLAP
ncbi:LysR family transcriptional regulator [Ramlibacter tataouinensis]|uniref:Transcriptional regulator, LysR family-like protein n=1 Tax=Ramlibacter tataouinensis (strain ATCC BAA-407 / DSM 14655 / LMG 21543 / TTB310) TaxID=365046 RepID=F5XWJ4_RAMTT|nr:LysR family transcriptional regulator [Ramlibacter tataouinensis]AEG92948.1 transcriptional regulator, LysR family-like protein [Ramlibacter tataouinensis TTB310]